MLSATAHVTLPETWCSVCVDAATGARLYGVLAVRDGDMAAGVLAAGGARFAPLAAHRDVRTHAAARDEAAQAVLSALYAHPMTPSPTALAEPVFHNVFYTTLAVLSQYVTAPAADLPETVAGLLEVTLPALVHADPPKQTLKTLHLPIQRCV